MAWNLKYQCTFDPFKKNGTSPFYTFKILFKDYSGEAKNVIGSTTPVRHNWQTDEAKPAIKGSSLTVNIINPNWLPITSFYANEDDTIKGQLYWGTQLLFEGFLVQDDCSEIMVDFTHEIQLTFTDNLGLLSDVTLDKTEAVYQQIYQSSSTMTEEISTTAPHTITSLSALTTVSGIASIIHTGDRLQIQGGGIANGTYNINGVSGNVFTIDEFIPTTGQQTVTLTVFRRVSLQNQSLLELVKVCLQATGLRLNANIYGNLYTLSAGQSYVTSLGANPAFPGDPGNIIQLLIAASLFSVGMQFTISGSVSNNGTFTVLSIDPNSTFARLHVVEAVVTENNTQDVTITFISQTWFLDTVVNPETFLVNDTDYDSCNSILTKILDRFNCTLFQSMGVWNIVRWDELRYYANRIPGRSYNSDFAQTGTVQLPTPFTAGLNQNTYPETGLLNRVFRPYKYDKETFNYHQPALLLKNYNLQQLGNLLRTYTTGSGTTLQTTREYTFPWWTWENNFPTSGTPADFFIRVVSDYLGNELERYAVVKNNSIHSYKVEANAGDYFKFSFSYRTADSQPGAVTNVFIVHLTDGTRNRYVREPNRVSTDYIEQGWGGGPGWRYNILSGDNSNVWHSVEIESQQIPFDGLLYFYLLKADNSGADAGTFYKDIRLEYIPLINQSTKIIGHTHTNTQDLVIKNKEDVEIFIDSSPRNSIAGTLFLPSLTGLLQTRTTKWKRGTVGESRNLGDITTNEILFWRRIPRTILEGTFYGLVAGGAVNGSLVINTGTNPFTQNASTTGTITGTPGSTVFVRLELSGIDPLAHVQGNIGGGIFVDITGPHDLVYTVVLDGTGSFTFNLHFFTSTDPAEIARISLVGYSDHLSMLTVVNYTGKAGLSFVFGKLEIDYKNNKVNQSTLWENNNNTEADADLLHNYEFKYLYATK